MNYTVNLHLTLPMTARYCHRAYSFHHSRTLPRHAGTHRSYVSAIYVAVQLGFLTNIPSLYRTSRIFPMYAFLVSTLQTETYPFPP